MHMSYQASANTSAKAKAGVGSLTCLEGVAAAPSASARSAGADTATVPAAMPAAAVPAEEALGWTAAVLLALLCPLVSGGA